MSEERDTHWLVRARTIRLSWRLGVAALAIVTFSDVAIEGHSVF